MDIYAPFAGIVRFDVADGQTVATGDRLAVVEAVKLEAPVEAPGPGTVRRGTVEDFADVAGGDALLRLDPLAEAVEDRS
jgi:biotin carboxyl carrier protein